MRLEDVNLLDLDVFRRREHHQVFSYLRAEHPFFWHETKSGKGFWNAVKHEDVCAINRSHKIFSSETGGVFIRDFHEEPDNVMDMRGKMMLMTDPPAHTRLRSLVSRGFTPRMISTMEKALRLRAEKIVDSIQDGEPFDFVDVTAAELPLQAIADILGVPQEERRKLFDWSNRLIGMDDPEYADQHAGLAALEIFEFAKQIAEQRQQKPEDDIATLLVEAMHGEEGLTEEEMCLFVLLLSVAGNETTRNAISGGMLAFAAHPEQTERFKAEMPEISDSTTEEILRWSTPVMYFRRTCSEPTEIREHEIAEGDRVLIWHVSANRDEEIFEDPFVFDIARDPNPHVTFGGGGVHFCLGAHLARLELKVMFEEIFSRVSEVELAEEPQFLRSNFIQGVKHMPMKFSFAGS